jgi:hypothetical protein
MTASLAIPSTRWNHANRQRASGFPEASSWWSFRENAAEQASSVVGFFDLFVGQEPDWEMPAGVREQFRKRLARLEPVRKAVE